MLNESSKFKILISNKNSELYIFCFTTSKVVLKIKSCYTYLLFKFQKISFESDSPVVARLV